MLSQIHHLLQNRTTQVEAWFDKKWRGKIPSLYLSCDIRHSGHKIAVVDANLFPAGFNNLCNSFSAIASQAFKNYLESYHPSAQKILIYGEEHTRNKFYLTHLLKLKTLIGQSGREVRIGVMGETFPNAKMTVSLENASVELEKIIRHEKPSTSHGILNQQSLSPKPTSAGDKISLEGFQPDLIISNNDFSTGLPSILEGITTPIVPLPQLGWHQRVKSRHFDILWNLLNEFGQEFGIDPWLLAPLTESVPPLDFQDSGSLKTASDKIDTLLEKIKTKYLEYNIKETPYVFIKNNAGTYGMGIVTVNEGKEILSLNSRQKNKLFSTKGKGSQRGFLIQEGIPTTDFYSEYPIEPVIYAIGKRDIGGFFRIHESKNEFESLNAPGMSFSCLCLHKLDEPHEDFFLNCQQKDQVVLVARFLARLSALATAGETT